MANGTSNILQDFIQNETSTKENKKFYFKLRFHG